MEQISGAGVPKMDWNSADLPSAWRAFKQHTEFMFSGPLNKKTEEEKCSYLMIWVGDAGRDIYNTWSLTGEEKKKLETYYSKYEAHVEPKSNVVFARYKFNERVQGENETFDQYITELKLIARQCRYTDQDEMIRDRIVFGCKSTRVREDLIKQGSELTLQQAIDIARIHEISQAQLKSMAGAEQVNVIRRYGSKKHKGKEKKPEKRQDHESKRSSNTESQVSTRKPCTRCGTRHDYRKCPAFGKECRKCKKPNHFAKMCQSTDVNNVEVESEEEDMFDDYFDVGCIDKIGSIQVNAVESDDEWTETLLINQNSCKVQLDTGAMCNIISTSSLEKLKVKQPVTKATCRLRTYSGHVIHPTGKVQLECQYKGQNYQLEFQVIEQDASTLIGAQACKQMEIIKRVHKVQKNPSESLPEILCEYPDVFQGLGCLSGEHTIQIDPSVKPVIHPPRKVPLAIRDKVKEELDRMEKIGVVTKQTEPTEWVNSMVTIVKPNKVRICIDPRDLNRAIKREHYPMKTIDEVLAGIKDAKLFSVLDATSGFWQIKLDEPSTKLCTFNTPFGRYRFNRLPFGIKSAPEVFQKMMTDLMSGIPATEVVVDDILVWGTNEKEHDESLRQVLDRARKSNLKLSLKKCKVKREEVQYVGHVLSKDGIKPDPEKVRAVKSMKAPTNVKELRTFLGFIQYLAKFIPNLSEVSAPLRELLVLNVAWFWEEPQEESFKKLKQLASQTPVLGFYNPQEEITLQVDASSKGLGAVLSQKEKPIAYASRALTGSQQRYAQIEKETLAVAYGLKKFHQYIYGKTVTIESDHKPLEYILNRSVHLAPPRIQRMMMQMMRYDYKVIYKPGKEMYISDALSRSYLSEATELLEEEHDVNEVQLNAHLPMSPDMYKKFQSSTAEDPVMIKLQDAVLDGWPATKAELPTDIRPYWNHRDEISCIDGLLFKGHKVIVPHQLKSQMLEKIHESHLGIVKCKQRARDILFWPGMASQIEDKVSQCTICSQHQRNNPKEPMITADIPERPWSKIGADLFEYDGATYLLTVDYYSKWPEIAKLDGLTSKHVIVRLKSQISRYGIPDEVVSDNGPQFASSEFKTFALQYGFRHTTSSPHYPQSNGEAERCVQTVKNILKKAKDPYLAILDYRNTPLEQVNKSPAQLMMGRRLKTTLPTTSALLKPADSATIKTQLQTRQASQAYYYNKNSGRELHSLQRGDPVRIQQGKKWAPAKVINQHSSPRSYVVQTPDGKFYRRNRRNLHSEKTPATTATEMSQPSLVTKTKVTDVTKDKTPSPVTDAAMDKTQVTDISNQVKPKEMGKNLLSHLLAKAQTPMKTTRSGRVIKPPQRLQDYEH